MNAVTRAYDLGTPIARLADQLQPLLLLTLRVYIAWVFIKAGLTKIEDWDTTLFLFAEEYKVPLLPPAIAAFMGTAGEIVLPPLLAIGLAGRFAALGLFIVNLMAVVSYPALWEFECPAAVEAHLWWGVGLLGLVAFGPGTLSVDRLLGRRRD
ncbi:DoxX family protein [Methyloversatilis sp.]|uniref:DoxX family protein n=1 Tax=Methyloversatilis sp. TaxID=2569862 RepID=UPI00273281A3|nr:DoxX family protein [Methyloversatilis sp.]MDP2870441.1 DoxX family protein [Methyloversatilis sp.]MDP3288063.1 DoxX family protein [Methyloversatilis sp.]MDP3457240.1 DoxX family protein [Methyloversatilis sp.]MDP3576632.1 DoxX family protein [Methyloversatilis sp.]